MANHASHAALPYPIKGARFTLLVPYLDADGDPTDPTTPDTEISKDDGAAADTAEEVASPKNSVAMLTLSGAETDCSCASLAAKAASGPKTTLATLYPRVLGLVESATAQAGAAGSITLAAGAAAFDLAGCFVRTTGGTGGGGTGGANNQARRITAYNSTTKVATVVPNWETTPSSDTTYEILLPEGMTLAMFAAIKAKTDNLPSDPADQSLIIAAADALAALINGLNNISAADVLTQINAALDAAVPDSIPADGDRPSIRQAAYLNTQFLLERTVSGTTLTVMKPDGTTPLFTCTLNHATAPTAITRAS